MIPERNLRTVTVLLVGFFLAFPHVALGQNSIWDTVDANALNQQVMQLYNQGRYSEAIPLAQRAFAGPSCRRPGEVKHNSSTLPWRFKSTRAIERFASLSGNSRHGAIFGAQRSAAIDQRRHGWAS
jgi:hypothetical protein